MAHVLIVTADEFSHCIECGVTWDAHVNPQEFECDEFNDCFDTIHPSKHSWMQSRPWHWIECSLCPAHRPTNLVNPHLVESE